MKQLLLVAVMLACTLSACANPSQGSSGTGTIPPVVAQSWAASEWTEVGTFTMEGNNLTPVKRIDSGDYDYVIVKVDRFSCEKPVQMSVEVVQAYTDRVLAREVSPLSTEGSDIEVICPVKTGDLFQIFFRITDEFGVYDDNLECNLTFSYKLTNL